MPPAPNPNLAPNITWPDGKRFAFSVFDDTDCATLENVASIYAMLRDYGLRTTKSCWVFRGDADKGSYIGQTCDDPAYRQWLEELQSEGFEIGWHGATWHGSTRQRILAGLDRFAEIFGHPPHIATNHTDCDEAMYWGNFRLTGWREHCYNLLTLRRNYRKYRGHLAGDEHFWGDACRERINYYRNFVFQDINTLKACPLMPYHDPLRPYVNLWFASSNGNHVAAFNRCLSEQNQDRIEEEGGACIMYTHFASGFLENGRPQPEFARLMKRLSQKDVWLVPVTTLLDHLLTVQGRRELTAAQRRRLERKWLWEKVFVGTN